MLDRIDLISNRIQIFIQAWIELLCSLINIVTFTAYRPWWDFAFMAWWIKRQLLKKTKKNIPQ